MTQVSQAYLDAEQAMDIPPVAKRGHSNLNPKGIGFWALVAEDFRTHDRKLFEQGFWAIFWHRFGNWRMGQPKIIRAPATLLYRVMFKLVEVFGGISLWYSTKLGRRVRIWHHSGMVLGCRAIGDDVHLRQNTTFGVGQTGQNDALPIICDRVDIGAGACIVGAIVVGADARIGGNALVIQDVPPGATMIGNPARVVMQGPTAAAIPAAAKPATISTAAPVLPAKPTLPAPPLPTPALPMRDAPADLGRIALLGSANLDLLAQSFETTARALGLTLTTVVPDFGTARMELLKPAEASTLQQAMAAGDTATLIVERAEDVLGEVASGPLTLPPEDSDAYLDTALEPMLQTVRDARTRLRGPVFVTRLAALERSSLGLADLAEPRGLAALIGRANDRIAAALAGLDDVHLIDTAALIAEVGQAEAAPGKFWHQGRLPFGPALNALLARRVLGGLLSLRGKSARIVVLDLDNTLWGGVLGEDGIEGVKLGGAYPGNAYKAFQTALRALTDRGIALAVASKNDEDLALRMLGEHPQMALHLSDIVAHRINWSEKAQNIQDMLDEIGLGAANCLFIDDNPVERAKVRKNLPDCIVPDFPAAPEALAAWLLDNPYLDTLHLTGSDLKRTTQYKVRSQVNNARRAFANIEEFYRGLEMELTFEPFSDLNKQRALQLFVKTNQFNATSRRHDGRALQSILADGEVYAIGVRDRHSEYELMGVLVLRPDAAMAAAYPQDGAVQAGRHAGAWWVDTFLMSCRILGRTIEQAILAWASDHVAAKGATALIGQIIETPRNTPVRKVFAASGFDPVPGHEGALWRRDIAAQGPVAVPGYFTILTPQGQPLTASPSPAAGPAAGPAAAAPESAPIRAEGDPARAEGDPALAAIFRDFFRLGPEVDLSVASMDTIAAWDSLNHLKLIMTVEGTLGITLPGTAMGEIMSYPQLAAAVTR